MLYIKSIIPAQHQHTIISNVTMLMLAFRYEDIEASQPYSYMPKFSTSAWFFSSSEECNIFGVYILHKDIGGTMTTCTSYVMMGRRL